MRAVRTLLVFLLLGAFVFLTQPLQAQSVYGQVWGRLTTLGAGTPVAAALVSVTSVQTGASAQTKTNTDGYFTISNLAPDLYQIDVQADGFKHVHDTAPVSADSTTTINSALQPGNPNELAATAPDVSVLKLDRTDVSTRFESQSVDDLPLLNLNTTRLELLVPGTSRGQLFIPTNQNPQGGVPVNVNGQHFSGTEFQLDGTENRDPLEGTAVINPTLDSVGEVKVTTQGYNAEFGQSTAGVVTVQTKSGTKAWHGDGFGFRRSGFGEADNPFSPGGVPPTKYTIFGGSLGGPLVKNKLFIFGDYQGTRSSQGDNLLLSVPPLSVEQSCLGPNAPMGSPANCNLSAYSNFITGNLTDSEGIEFPNYMIPNTGPANSDHFVSSQAAAVLALLPPPNYVPTDPVCGVGAGQEAVCNNYLASGQEAFNANQLDIRSDYNASKNLRVFGRYSFGQFYDNGSPAFGAAAGGMGVNPSGFAGLAQTRNQGISSGFTESLSPKLLTDFRFGYVRYRLNVNALDSGTTSDFGIPGISAADTGNPFATGLPDFEIPALQGFTGDYLRLGYSTPANSCDCPLREREQEFQFVNNWTRTTGRHILKWGTDLRFLQNYRLTSDRPPTGYFSFAPGITGTSPGGGANASGLGLATFLIGDVTTFERTISSASVVNAGEHQKRFGFYGQDTWRISPRLTLNYGLRWEIYFPQTLTGAGGFLIPDLNNNDPSKTYFSGPPTGGILGNLTNFAPRLGIAYLLNPTTVFRAGYGRSFDAGYAGDLFGIAGTNNPPVTAQQTIEGVGFNLQNGPPLFHFPTASPVSLLTLAAANIGNVSAPIPVPESGTAIYALPSRVRVPTVDSWNVTVQHELSSQLYFELAYVGNKGTYVFTDNTSGATYYDLTQPSLQNLIVQTIKNGVSTGFNYANCKSSKLVAGVPTKGAIFTSSDGQEQYCLTVPQIRSFYQPLPIPGTSCPTKANPAQLCAFDPTLFPINYFGNNANDNYNSLQAKVRKNFSRGYSLLAHYTWSKGLDYAQNYYNVDPRQGYGPASFDIRQRFVMTNIWELPFGRGKEWLNGVGPVADRFVGGWSLSAVTIWQSGLPFTPTYQPSTCALDSDTGGDPCRPNLVGSVHISGNREQYFTTTGGLPLQPDLMDCSTLSPKYCGVDANNGGVSVPGPAIGPWQRPGPGQIGNAGRDSLSGPGFFQSDIGLAKLIAISERVNLRFRADGFNVFNKVNLGQPDACVDCAVGAGAITSLAAGAFQRQLQFTLRVEF